MADLTEFYPAATFGAGSGPMQPTQAPMPRPGVSGTAMGGGGNGTGGAGFNLAGGITTNHLSIGVIFVVLAGALILLHLE